MEKQFGPDADVEKLAKSFVDTKTLLSSTKRVPGQDATPDDWAKFHETMGRPPTADGYDLPSEPGSAKAILEALRPTAYQKGLSREQFASLAAQIASETGASQKKVEELASSWEKRFREANGDKADARLADAKATLDKLIAGDPTIKEALETTGLAKHPGILDAVLKVRSAMSDDKSPFNATPAQPPGPTPGELHQKGMAIMQSKEYTDVFHPMHEIAKGNLRQVMADLMAQGFSGLSDSRLIPRPTFRLPDGTVIK